MNTPNKLTLLRIFLVVPFITLSGLAIDAGIVSTHGTYYMLSAGCVFALAMLTGWFDGYLARKNDQITSFGKLFDPLADKFLTTSALIVLSVGGIIPFYITLIFVLRDLLVDGSRNLAAKNKVEVSASFIGKSKTMLMSIGIILIFFITPYINNTLSLISPSWEIWVLISPIILAAILSTISGYKYIKAITPFINAK